MSLLERKNHEDAALPEELKHVFDLAYQEIGHQFQVAERLDAKARGQVTLAAAWFAVVQAVAGVSYAARPGTIWLVLLLGTTLIGGIALIVTFFYSFRVWKPRKEKELTHDGFRKLVDKALSEDDRALTDELVTYYQHVLGHRRESNEARVEQLKSAQNAWAFAVVFTFVELNIALLARLFG